MTVHVESRGAVRHVTIDRPSRRNALDAAHVEELRDAVTGSPADTRALVLRGGDGHLCAGADLKGIEGPEFAVLLRGLLHALRDAPFPCIAGIEGAALGAGAQLAISCDLRTTTSDATIGVPAAKLGLMVDAWTVQRLVALAGRGRPAPCSSPRTRSRATTPTGSAWPSASARPTWPPSGRPRSRPRRP